MLPSKSDAVFIIIVIVILLHLMPLENMCNFFTIRSHKTVCLDWLYADWHFTYTRYSQNDTFLYWQCDEWQFVTFEGAEWHLHYTDFVLNVCKFHNIYKLWLFLLAKLLEHYLESPPKMIVVSCYLKYPNIKLHY